MFTSAVTGFETFVRAAPERLHLDPFLRPPGDTSALWRRALSDPLGSTVFHARIR